MTDGQALARAAQDLVGCPFRLNGRDPATGLDCVGVLAAVLAVLGRPARLPIGYRLRGSGPPGLADLAARHGFAAMTDPAAPPAPGEVWVLRPGPGQWHLGMVSADCAGLIEAHAGLRRVVRSPLPSLADPGLAGLSRWRLTE